MKDKVHRGGVCKERLSAVAPVNRANGYFCHSFALMYSFDHQHLWHLIPRQSAPLWFYTFHSG